MQNKIKLGSALAKDIGNCLDIYWAEVSRGEWQADLIDLKYEGKASWLIINNIEGAILMAEQVVAEIEQAIDSMYWSRGTDEYRHSRNTKLRLQGLLSKILDLYPDWRTHPDRSIDYGAFIK